MMNKLNILITALLVFAGAGLTANAQITAALALDKPFKGTGFTLFCDSNFNCGMKSNENSKIQQFNRNILIKVERNGEDFYLQFNDKRDATFAGNRKTPLKSGDSVLIDIEFSTDSGSRQTLPYKVSHDKKVENGDPLDSFSIFSQYAAAGSLNYKECSSKILLSDMNLDGKFTSADASGGTNIRIDFNNDQVFGKGEFKTSNDIIEFCGQKFLVSKLSEMSLTLNPTDLQIVKVGAPVPSFSLDLLNTKILTSVNLKGKAFLLDFWASWCGPCVGNLSKIASIENSYKNKLAVYSINLDHREDLELAKNIISEKKIYDFTAMRGMGLDDTLWKTFGDNVHYIPAYILVDQEGIVRYASSGGENLEDLKAEIVKLKLDN